MSKAATGGSTSRRPSVIFTTAHAGWVVSTVAMSLVISALSCRSPASFLIAATTAPSGSLPLASPLISMARVSDAKIKATDLSGWKTFTPSTVVEAI